MSGVQIRVGDLLYAVVKRWKMAVVMAFMGLGFGIVLSGISYIQGRNNNYEIHASIALTSQSASGNFSNNSAYPGPNDFYLAQDLVDAAGYVMKSDRVLEEAIEKAGVMETTPKDISKNLTFSRYNETQIVEIAFRWWDGESGIRLLNEILEVSAQTLPETLMIGSVSVIDQPNVSTRTGGGKITGLWAVLSVLGLFAGAGMAVLELIMRPTLLNLKDVEQVFGLETIGIIPKDENYFQNKTELLEKTEMNSAVEQNFASSAYILRNRLGSRETQHCFYVTSAGDGEGKSTVSANLAIQLSDMEKKVLLIDLDLKNPSLGGMFLHNVDYSRTLNALYKGEATEQEAVISLTGYLDFLPSVLERNSIPLDGTLFDFVKKISENYEYVIIDAPAVGQVSDTLSLNQIAHMVLFVIRYDTASISEIQDAIEKLDKSGIEILGAIVNANQSLKEMHTRNTKSDSVPKKVRTDEVARDGKDISMPVVKVPVVTKSETVGSGSEFKRHFLKKFGTKKQEKKNHGPQQPNHHQQSHHQQIFGLEAEKIESRQIDPFKRNLMEELMGEDLLLNPSTLSDEEAVEALIRLGADESWKKAKNPQNSESERQTDPQSRQEQKATESENAQENPQANGLTSTGSENAQEDNQDEQKK